MGKYTIRDKIPENTLLSGIGMLFGHLIRKDKKDRTSGWLGLFERAPVGRSFVGPTLSLVLTVKIYDVQIGDWSISHSELNGLIFRL